MAYRVLQGLALAFSVAAFPWDGWLGRAEQEPTPVGPSPADGPQEPNGTEAPGNTTEGIPGEEATEEPEAEPFFTWWL